MAMTKKAKAAKAAYLREWHARHPDKRKKYAETYWKRKAAKLSESAAKVADTENINTSKEENNYEKQN